MRHLSRLPQLRPAASYGTTTASRTALRAMRQPMLGVCVARPPGTGVDRHEEADGRHAVAPGHGRLLVAEVSPRLAVSVVFAGTKRGEEFAAAG